MCVRERERETRLCANFANFRPFVGALPLVATLVALFQQASHCVCRRRCMLTCHRFIARVVDGTMWAVRCDRGLSDIRELA